MVIAITSKIMLDERELTETFMTSSGPGGQNVNKVATAVRLRFDARKSLTLTDAVKARLSAIAGQRMTKDGIINIVASRFASQERNRADALDRLLTLLRAAATPPEPRHKTRVSKTQKRKRLDDKARRSKTKTLRVAPGA